MHINDLLKIAVERKASDLHLKVGAFPVIRIDGTLIPLVDMRRLMQEDTIAMAFSIMSARQKEKFKNNFEIDIAYSVPNLGRFRCNIFQQRGTVGLVLPRHPGQDPDRSGSSSCRRSSRRSARSSAASSSAPGRPGSGKSTTLAAMIDHINATRNEHIMTVEDPIEFLHRDKKSIVNQREVDVDTKGFSIALRSALRQDPDVILVGEMRDYETIETALTAAETGHLVFSTLHTLDATETINRIIAVFPPHQQKQIRLQLGAVLKAVVSLRLMPRADGLGRVPAVEILIRDQLRPRVHREQGEDEVHQGRDPGRARRSTGCRPSTSRSTASTSRASSRSRRRSGARRTPTSSSSRSRASSRRRTSPGGDGRGPRDADGLQPAPGGVALRLLQPDAHGKRLARAEHGRRARPGRPLRADGGARAGAAPARRSGRAAARSSSRALGGPGLRGRRGPPTRSSRLEDEGLLDDLAAARSRGADPRGAGTARARLERELRARGFSSETIARGVREPRAPRTGRRRPPERVREALERRARTLAPRFDGGASSTR